MTNLMKSVVIRLHQDEKRGIHIGWRNIATMQRIHMSELVAFLVLLDEAE